MKTETKNEWQEVAEAQAEIILNQSQTIDELEHHNRSIYIWMALLGVLSTFELLILIF